MCEARPCVCFRAGRVLIFAKACRDSPALLDTTLDLGAQGGWGLGVPGPFGVGAGVCVVLLLS